MKMSGKPNIILIFSDQHRGDALGCTGNESVITPNLDRLAANSVTFTRCYTNSPICVPARVSLITGQNVCHHGVWNNRSTEADRYGPSHVRTVRDAGYHTMLFGKTHLYIPQLGEHTNDRKPTLRDWGYIDTHELSGFNASVVQASPYTDRLKEKGLWEVHKQYIQDMYVGMKRQTVMPWEDPPSPLPVKENLDYYTGQKAAEWIENYQGEKPFYLQVLFPGPHNPFDSPQEYRDLYNTNSMPAGIMATPTEPLAPLVKSKLKSSGLAEMSIDQKRLLTQNYYAKISLIDERIGAIMAALERSGRADNTWVIYTSDHGEMLGDHRIRGKMVFFDGAARIPCIVRPPGGIQGWQSQGLTDLIDIAATIVDIAGGETMGGEGVRSLLGSVSEGSRDSQAQKGKDAVFSETQGFSMVRTDRYKMVVEAVSREVVELYDMVNDPQEQSNLALDDSTEDLRKQYLDSHFARLYENLNEEKLAYLIQYLKKPSQLDDIFKLAGEPETDVQGLGLY